MTEQLKIKTLGQVAERKSVALYNMDELALQVATSKKLSGGVLFARNSERVNKDEARARVLDLFSLENWPGRLSMLTMPGIHWRFERLLLGSREVGWMRKTYPKRTHFTGVENDRAIYFAVVAQMPGLHTPNGTLKQLNGSPFAEMAVKTRYASFFFANVDDLMQSDRWQDGWHAAWLDFTGQTTLKQMALIADFYRKYVRHILVLTTMKSRWHTGTNTAITAAGSYSQCLRDHLPGDVLHDLEYHDTSTMSQFAVRKS